MSHRLPLPYNTILTDNKNIKIENLIGRGSTCLVYEALYIDHFNYQHKLRVKEFYPKQTNITRVNQLLQYENETEFHQLYKQFLKGYENNILLQNELGLNNDTTTAFDIIQANNTYYLLISYDDGISYDKYQEPSFASLIKHLINLCSIISKIHHQNYLHLDIKSDNLLLLKDQDTFKLLDFDTITSIEHSDKPSTYNLYSAPEQKAFSNCTNFTSDIFSIGAIFFEKLYGRIPNILDYQINTSYNDKFLLDDTMLSYHSKMMIHDILRHTLNISQDKRYPTIDHLINALQLLLPYCDEQQIHFVNQYHYECAHFIGRHDELSFMFQHFQIKNTLFIHGMGGIGKSELVKKYIELSDYDYVYFLVFNKRIINTISNDDSFSIHHYQYHHKQSLNAYFKAKMEVIQKLCEKSKTLIVLDNFDVEEDEHLEMFLKLKAHKIITTRYDYSDYNISTLALNTLKNKEELMALFTCYNQINYAITQQDALHSLFKFFEYHTMSIELLAKLLRDQNKLPTTFLNEIQNRFGVNLITYDQSRLRKDEHFYRSSMKQHFELLFDLSSFTNQEIHYFASLALLGPIYIKLDLFCDWMNIENNDTTLLHLIQKGWIKYEHHKLHLHQIILDLIYERYYLNHFFDDTIVDGLCRWMNQPCNYYDKNIKKKLLMIIFDRIENEHLKLKLYDQYLNNIDTDIEIYQTFINLCKKHQQDELLVFQLIPYCKAIIKQRPLTDLSFEDEVNLLCQQISPYLNKAIDLAKNLKVDIATQILKQYHGLLTDFSLAFSMTNNDTYLSFNNLIDEYILFAYDIDYLLTTNINLDTITKTYYYNKLVYAMCFDITSMYIIDYCDFKKHISYFKSKTNEFNDISYYDLGLDAYYEQDYNQAITYLKLSLCVNETTSFNIEQILADCYEQTKQYDQAITIYQQLINNYLINPFAIYQDEYYKLSCIYMKINNQQEAYLNYEYHIEQINEPLDYLYGYLLKVKLDETFNIDTTIAIQTLLNFYHQNTFDDNELLNFYLWYIDYLPNDQKALFQYRVCMIYINIFEYEQAYNLALSILKTSDEQILFRVYFIIIYTLHQLDRSNESITYLNLLTKLNYPTSLNNLIEHYYGYSYEDETICMKHRQNCNYYELIQYFINLYQPSKEDKIQALKWAIDHCNDANNYPLAHLCFNELIQLDHCYDHYYNQIINALYFDHKLCKQLIHHLTSTYHQEYHYDDLSRIYLELKMNDHSIQCMILEVLKYTTITNKSNYNIFTNISLSDLNKDKLDHILLCLTFIVEHATSDKLILFCKQLIHDIHSSDIEYK